jgi:hypothetical protein
MKLSERYGREVMGFVEALALAIAADDEVKQEEAGIAEQAIRAASFDLSDNDRELLARFTMARASEIIAASFAAVSRGEEEVKSLTALLLLNLEAISQASPQRDAIISAAQDIIRSDGEVTEKESAILACLDTCLLEGPSAAFRSLRGMPENA